MFYRVLKHHQYNITWKHKAVSSQRLRLDSLAALWKNQISQATANRCDQSLDLINLGINITSTLTSPMFVPYIFNIMS